VERRREEERREERREGEERKLSPLIFKYSLVLIY
jgi:hypothetical protein